jgi:hypothetical protein
LNIRARQISINSLPARQLAKSWQAAGIPQSSKNAIEVTARRVAQAAFDPHSYHRSTPMLRIGSLATLVLCLAGPAAAQDAEVLAELYGAGVHSFYSGDLDAAHDSFTTVIERGTKDPRPFYFRSLVYLQYGRPDEAQADMAAGAELEMEDVDGYYDVSRALERIQGRARLQLERHRAKARLANYQRQQQRDKERYEARERREDAVLRRQADVPLDDLPTPGEGAAPSTDAPMTDPGKAADPFGEPAAEPAVEPKTEPADDPFGAPATEPKTEPADDPFGAPATEPKTEPADDPFGAPAAGPAAEPTVDATAEVPDDQKVEPGILGRVLGRALGKAMAGDELDNAGTAPPAGGGGADPFGGPATEPAAEPADDPFGAPPAAKPAEPADDPFGAPPATKPAEPADDPFGAPATTPAEPADDPFGAPATEPAAEPADDPFGAPPATKPAEPADDPFGAPADKPAEPADDPFGDDAGGAPAPSDDDPFGVAP